MMYNPYSLAGKTILVTGASSGIGQSVAVECSKMGAVVIITGRNEERLAQTFSMLEGEGHLSFIADMSSHEDIKQLTEYCPQLDGVSHNAGIAKTVLVKQLSKNALEEILNVNTVAPILLTQLLVRNKKVKKQASIVFTSSLSGVYNVHYGDALNATSKGAVNGFAKGAALDLSDRKIRVNCINPGMIYSENLLKNTILTEDELKEKERFFPLKRFGSPKDAAFGVVFFLSDASSWITGDNLIVDGGYTLI